jgi:hypothetical protein
MLLKCNPRKGKGKRVEVQLMSGGTETGWTEIVRMQEMMKAEGRKDQ